MFGFALFGKDFLLRHRLHSEKRSNDSVQLSKENMTSIQKTPVTLVPRRLMILQNSVTSTVLE